MEHQTGQQTVQSVDNQDNVLILDSIDESDQQFLDEQVNLEKKTAEECQKDSKPTTCRILKMEPDPEDHEVCQ